MLLITLLMGVQAVSGSSEQQLTVEVSAGGEECYYQFLDVGESLTVDYSVLDTSGGLARLDIDMDQVFINCAKIINQKLNTLN